MNRENATVAGFPSLGDENYLRSPYPFYDKARAETPVFFNPEISSWMVTRYEDAMTVLRDPVTFSSRCMEEFKSNTKNMVPEAAAILATGYPPTPVLSESDDPVHAYTARLCKEFLSAKYLRSLGPKIEEIARGLVGRMRPASEIDFVDYTAELAVAVMCHFVGVDPEDSDVIIRGSDAEVAMHGRIMTDQEAIGVARDYVAEQHLVARRIGERRLRPRDDIISHLLTYPQSVGEEPLTMDVLVQIVKLLMLAGNETTRNLMSHAMLRLANDPQLQDEARRDPQILEAVIEETLRCDGPVVVLLRRVTKDVQLNGANLDEGDMVLVGFTVADHDPTVFECPHEFRLGRTNVRKHLGFGFGTHFCLGAPLARLEAKIGLGAMLERFEHITPVEGKDPTYSPLFIVYGVSSLPLHVSSGSLRSEADLFESDFGQHFLSVSLRG